MLWTDSSNITYYVHLMFIHTKIGFSVFYATFNNVSVALYIVILAISVALMNVTGVSGEDIRPSAS